MEGKIISGVFFFTQSFHLTSEDLESRSQVICTTLCLFIYLLIFYFIFGNVYLDVYIYIKLTMDILLNISFCDS